MVRDANTGVLVREGRAPHPDGTEVDPAAWATALTAAIESAGGLADVDAMSVGAQQHGMVCLDASGAVVRPALLWNDTRSAPDAAALVSELGGGDVEAGGKAWAAAVGSVPVASFTVTKLRWLATHEPDAAKRTAAVCLPHDWLTWRLAGGADIAQLTTDRSDASGTGYWSGSSSSYRTDLLQQAFGSVPLMPRVLGPAASAGKVGDTVIGAGAGDVLLGPGAGDNAAAALGLGTRPGDVIVSIGTSGTVFGVSTTPAADASGAVAGFADATGHFLPLVCTLNAARVFDVTAAMLGVDVATLAELALSVPAGADGLVVVPYLEGERTPNRPDATGAIHGWCLHNSTAAHLARAAFEGVLCGLADGLDALIAEGCAVERIVLIGGAARSAAMRSIAPAIFGRPVTVPSPGEYVADGAARQAAWALSGAAEPPAWERADTVTYEAVPSPSVRSHYAEVRDLTVGGPRF